MLPVEDFNIDTETIDMLGLKLSEKEFEGAQHSNTRIFEYPHLKDVFIMESDLYGNKMPDESCFLAFPGEHGFIGKHMKIKELRSASVEDIKDLVDNNAGG